MADMRLIVAGAGGKMGRTLIRAIAETPGAVLTGALEAPGSELLGQDSGLLAGLPANGVALSADLWALSKDADGILDFTVPAATIANVAIAAQRGIVHVIGTTGLSASDNAVIRSVASQAVVVQFQVGDDGRIEQAHGVGRDRIAEAGMKLLGHRRAAHDLAALHHAHAQAGHRQIGRAGEAVVARADDDNVGIEVGHDLSQTDRRSRHFTGFAEPIAAFCRGEGGGFL